MHDMLEPDRGSRRDTLIRDPPSCMDHPQDWVAGPGAQEGHGQRRAGSTVAIRQAALGPRFERSMFPRTEEMWHS